MPGAGGSGGTGRAGSGPGAAGVPGGGGGGVAPHGADAQARARAREAHVLARAREEEAAARRWEEDRLARAMDGGGTGPVPPGADGHRGEFIHRVGVPEGRGQHDGPMTAARTPTTDAPVASSDHATSPGAPGAADLDPAAPKPRLHGLDLARGLAVLGMFVAHTAAAGPYAEGTWLGEVLSWSHGRSSILFALLAGVSLGILTGRTRPYTGEGAVHARTRILVRGVLLLGISGMLAMLNGQVALILAFYAAWFFLALPFAWWPARRLFAAAAVVAVAGPLLRWALATLLPAIGMVVDTQDVNDFFVETMVSGVYPGLAYMAFVFAGMGLARLDLSARRLQVQMLAIGVLLAVVGYGGGWALATVSGVDTTEPDSLVYAEDGGYYDEDGEYVDGLEPKPYPADDGLGGEVLDTADLAESAAAELLATWPHSGSTFEILGSGGVALAILALCLLLPAAASRTVLAPLAAVGAMSLTAYSTHVVVLALLPMMVGAESIWPAVALVGAALLGCWAWRATKGRGPLELLLHTVSVRATRPPAV